MEISSSQLPARYRLARQLGKHLNVRGSERILRLLAPQTTAPPVEGCVTSWDGTVVQVDTRSYLEWLVLLRGGYEIWLQKLMHELTAPGDVVVDVGANVGLHTCSLARHVGARGRVLAIEALDELADRLEQNAALNGLANVSVVRIAASDRVGSASIFLPAGAGSNRGMASFHADNGDGGRSIATDTVDHLAADLRPVRLIKIDVEGHEFAVLRGCQEILIQDRPYVLFEFSSESYRSAGVSFGEVAALLSDAGYSLEDGLRRTPLRTGSEPITQTMVLATPRR